MSLSVGRGLLTVSVCMSDLLPPPVGSDSPGGFFLPAPLAVLRQARYAGCRRGWLAYTPPTQAPRRAPSSLSRCRASFRRRLAPRPNPLPAPAPSAPSRASCRSWMPLRVSWAALGVRSLRVWGSEGGRERLPFALLLPARTVRAPCSGKRGPPGAWGKPRLTITGGPLMACPNGPAFLSAQTTCSHKGHQLDLLPPRRRQVDRQSGRWRAQHRQHYRHHHEVRVVHRAPPTTQPTRLGSGEQGTLRGCPRLHPLTAAPHGVDG